MIVLNQTKNINLASECKEAVLFFDRLLGLLKKSNPRSLFFETRFGIHTFFLKEPIDVVVLDNNWRVVKFSTASPNSFFFWNPKFSHILELPKGTVKKTKTQVGDFFKLKP